MINISVNFRETSTCLMYSIVAWCPGWVGVYLRALVAHWGAAQVGMGLQLDTGIRITGWNNIVFGDNVRMTRLGSLHAHDGRLRIGNNVSIGSNSSIAPCNGGSIEISDDVLIAQNIVIRAADHRFDQIDRPISQQGHIGGEIFIETGAWIGANSVVTSNVRIGQHAIVGAGSVVTRDVDPFCIVGGVPAKFIRKRIDSSEGR